MLGGSNLLEVVKGTSSKVYENEFFRKISKELSLLFQQNSWDGLLIGMPYCIPHENLQIDCLLLTKHQLIIIDFKNYSGHLSLPDSNTFSQGEWRLNKNTIVRGGNSKNPYQQLQKQRFKLINELENRIVGFENKTVSTMVCFQDKINISGEIPKKFRLGFSIVDPSTYLNQLADIIDVLPPNKKIDYLSKSSKEVFTKTVFQANHYDFSLAEKEIIITKKPLESISPISHADKITDFIKSDNRIMTITGNIQSGKTTMIPQIRELAFQESYTHVPVLAYSNRLKQKMLEKHPEFEDVDSIYSTIYDFSLDIKDENHKKYFPLKTSSHLLNNNYTLENADEFVEEKALYLIDDSQLITNSEISSDDIKYGSGKILNDLLDYVSLETNSNSKIIFIGDLNKLGFGSENESALNTKYIESLLISRNLKSKVDSIILENNTEKNSIIQTCNLIGEKIKNDYYNYLLIETKDEVTVNKKIDQLRVMSEVLEKPYSKKLIVSDNKRAGKINHFIKKKIMNNGIYPNTSDLIIFNSTINATQVYNTKDYQFSFGTKKNDNNKELKKVFNGTFGEIINIDYANVLEKHEIINEQKIVLRFIPCSIKLQNNLIIETHIFENFLNSEKNRLSTDELVAFHSLIRKIKDEALNKIPFENSIEFKEMIASDKFTIKIKNGKKLYRDKNDTRKLTSYESAFRKRIFDNLEKPGTEYYILINSARVKYAWAMTIKKAMAYNFNEVFFITDDEYNGKTNKEYFKRIYTGLSIATDTIHLLNWNPISPFMKTIFSEDPIYNQIASKKTILFKATSVDKSIAEQLKDYIKNNLPNSYTVNSISSKPYLEIVKLEQNSREIELFFDYNKFQEIRVPRLKSGNEVDYSEIKSHLTETPTDLLNETDFMMSIWKELKKELVNSNFELIVTEIQEWNVTLKLNKSSDFVKIRAQYNKKGEISYFNYLYGNLIFYQEVVEQIHMKFKSL